MLRALSSLIAGLIFGLGLVISGMINPAKVQNFLDVTGSWDPSLAFVMGAALIVTGIGFRAAAQIQPAALRRQLPVAHASGH
jgi:uncharacterized membrane protein YedE/YeeE